MPARADIAVAASPAAASEVRGRESMLRVGGLTPLSSTDYPDHLCAVVFCQGCPWRCGYCHNPHLLPAQGTAALRWPDVVAFLERRVGLLDAVVFSGGEPLAQPAIASAMCTVKAMEFRVGLHTGGAYPARLATVLPIVDWVGFDIKASFDDYARITGARNSGEAARISVRMLVASGIAHEFRTTVHPRQHSPEQLERVAGELAAAGARRYVVQEFRALGCADDALRTDVPPSFLTDAYCARMATKFESFTVRRA